MLSADEAEKKRLVVTFPPFDAAFLMLFVFDDSVMEPKERKIIENIFLPCSPLPAFDVQRAGLSRRRPTHCNFVRWRNLKLMQAQRLLLLTAIKTFNGGWSTLGVLQLQRDLLTTRAFLKRQSCTSSSLVLRNSRNQFPNQAHLPHHQR